MSKVEEVAKAIYQATPRNKPFERLSAHQRNVRLAEARAAIEAMRWPTDSMKTSGATIGHWADHALGDEWDEADNVWQAMISAALNEEG